MSNKNAHVLVGGDFNCGNIEWSTMQVPEGGTTKASSISTLRNCSRSLPIPNSPSLVSNNDVEKFCMPHRMHFHAMLLLNDLLKIPYIVEDILAQSDR